MDSQLSDDGLERSRKPETTDISITRQALNSLEEELQVARISSEENYKFGWLHGLQKLLIEGIFWLRGPDTYRLDNSWPSLSAASWFIAVHDITNHSGWQR
jgi:hypothetical protein